MNTATILSMILCAMGAAVFTNGCYSIALKKKKTVNRNLFFIVCIFSSIEFFGYAYMGIQDNPGFAYYFRVLAIIGAILYTIFTLFLFLKFLDTSSADISTAMSVVIMAALIACPAAIAKRGSTFSDTSYGYYFTVESDILRLGICLFSVVCMGILLAVSIGKWKFLIKKQERITFWKIILCEFFFLMGLISDVFQQFTGRPYFPVVLLMQLITIVLIKVLVLSQDMQIFTMDHFFHYICSAVETPIVVLNDNREVELYNDSATGFFHSFGIQLVGKSLKDLFHFETDLKEVFEHGSEEEKYNTDHVDATCYGNGARCVLEVNHVYDRYGDKIADIIVVNDITEKVKIIEELNESRQEAVKANEAKSSFLANMSHEIRTPMNAIIGISELILRKELPDDVKDDVISIQNSGNGLLSIINDILDISKIESGKYEIIPVDYTLFSLISDALNMTAMRLKGKPVHLLMELNPTLPSRLYGDDLRIKQILINILGNAVKFTNSGFIKMSIDWNGQYGKASGGTALFSIKITDTGVGIKQSDMNKLFGLFNQVDTKKNRSITGTGLGLAISRTLAELMGGTVNVESVYGEGSVFTIILRQTIKEYEPIIELDSPQQYYVAVLEDDEEIMINMERIFKSNHIPYIIYKSVQEIDSSIKYTHFLTRTMNLYEAESYLKKTGSEAELVILTDADDPGAASYGYRYLSLLILSMQIGNLLSGKEIVHVTSPEKFDIGKIKNLSFARALIVDDNETNLVVSKGLMQPYGMKIDTAMDGKMAIELIQKNYYDIVFMDHMMPGMDGIETMHMLSEIPDERIGKIPVVALTANAISGAKEMFAKSGFADFLAKPIDLISLNRILETWVYEKAGKEKIAMSEATVREQSQSAEQRVIEAKKTDSGVKSFIQGVRTDIGLKYAGNNLDTYHIILKTYYPDMYKCMKAMREAFEKNDLKLFSIHAHAIKSASAGVGASEVSEMAKTLEFAGKEESRSKIEGILDIFYKEFEKILQSIGDYLNKIQEKETLSGEETLQYKNEIDQELKESLYRAIDNMDSMGAQEILDQINQNTYNAEISYCLEKIEKELADFRYEHAMKYMKLLH